MKQLFASAKKQAAYEFLIKARDQNNMIRTNYRDIAANSSCTMAGARKIVIQLESEGYLNIVDTGSGGTLIEVWTPEERQIS